LAQKAHGHGRPVPAAAIDVYGSFGQLAHAARKPVQWNEQGTGDVPRFALRWIPDIEQDTPRNRPPAQVAGFQAPVRGHGKPLRLPRLDPAPQVTADVFIPDPPAADGSLFLPALL